MEEENKQTTLILENKAIHIKNQSSVNLKRQQTGSQVPNKLTSGTG